MRQDTLTHESRMRKYEWIVALCWLPMHMLVLPMVLTLGFPQMSLVDLNLWTYVIGTAAVCLVCARFLVSDMVVLWERPGKVFLQVLMCFGFGLVGNAAVGLIVQAIAPGSNPNNDAVMELAGDDGLKMAILTVFLAPVLEELMFRGAIFGLIRRKSRVLAYIVCILLFGAYHIWGYAISDPIAWVYLLQYVPLTFLLCFAYDRTESIWTSILFHMANNAFSLWALSLQDMLA